MNFYINSSIHVALAVVSLTVITAFEFGFDMSLNLFGFVGFASIVGYNFVKYFGLAKFHYRSLSGPLKLIQVFSLFCMVFMFYFALNLRKESIIAISIFGFITFLYANPLISDRFFMTKKKELRGVSGLKIYLIAMVWTGVTVILPVLEAQVTLNTDIVLTGFQRFIFVVVLMLPFEIRDLNYDSLKLSTIPQQIGVKWTKILGVLLLGLMLSLEFFKDSINTDHLLTLLFIGLLTMVFVLFSSKQQGKYYSAFWVESIPVFWMLLMWLL
ncbi:hypothetical protein AB9K26_01275 [Psychroserpens sp. XS_ASV72]|uniref:hypothetical protein n=1 Tax=Psychroserpens sp. XS_ASV72 TaxID=3241293 RepID=UPI003518409F